MHPSRPGRGAVEYPRRVILRRAGELTAGAALGALVGTRAFAPIAARAASATTILYNSAGFTCEGAVWAAQAQGYYRDEGLDVTFVGVADPGDEFTRLAKGAADAMPNPAWAMAPQWLPPGMKVGDAVATAGLIRGCGSLVVAPDSPIQNVADLKGQKVAAAPPWRFIFGEPMGKAGLDPMKDVTWQAPLDPPALATALANKDVAAGFALEPFSAMLESAGKARSLIVQDMPPMMMDYCCSVIVSGALLRSDKAKAAAITRALMRGAAWIAAQPMDAARLEVDGKHVPANLADNQQAMATIAFSPSVADAVANTRDVFGRMQRLGFLDPGIDVGALVAQLYVPVTGELPASGASAMGSASDPVAHAADGAGRALWAAQHGGDPSGYDGISRTDQVTWNSVAVHGH